MKYTFLSDTDIQVSKICLGTMTFGEQNTEDEAHEQLDFAFDHGVNFIDTAELYAVPTRPGNFGKTEEYIGSWFEKSGKRDSIILATKVTGPADLPHISTNLGFSRERIMEAVDNSLRKLKTDYIDVYQLHWPERYVNNFGKRDFDPPEFEKWKYNLDVVAGIMDDLVKAGKIRFWGLSNETPWGVMKFLEECKNLGIHRPVSIQNPYSLLNRTYEIGMAELSLREDIGLLAYSPMAFGLLSGKYHRGKDTPRDRINKYSQLSRYNGETAYLATAEYIKIAEKYGISPAKLALAFVNSRPFVTSNIIGATTMDQLKENIDSINVDITKDILDDIQSVHQMMPNPAP